VAKLRIGSDKYDVNINFGRMLKAVVSGNVGAWFESEDCDVLEISDGKITVQGIGTGILNIAQNGNVRSLTVDFTDNSISALEI